jgi:hypothetical protein
MIPMTEEVMLRTSERKAFRNCPQAWHWRYREGLVPNGRPAAPLWFGTGVHVALAEWYLPGLKRGLRPATTFSKWLKAEKIGADEFIVAGTGPDGNSQYEDATILGKSMLTKYVDLYGKDEDKETLAIEQSFQIDLKDSRGNYLVTSVGTFDGVFYDNIDGRIYLWEHKTANKIATAFLALDAQAGTYYAVATQVLRAQGILSPKESIDGVLYNYLRKAKPDPRPRNADGLCLNKNGSVSLRQPAKEFHREVIERSPGEVNRQLQRLADDALWMRAVESGRAPLIKNTGYNCPYCPFFDLCQLDEKGNQRAVKAYKKSSFSYADPYADHRKSTEE